MNLVAKRVCFLFLFCILVLLHYNALATHIYGGELLYTHISGDSYKVTLTLYGDCEGQNFPRLHNATPTIKIYNGFSTNPTQVFAQEDITQRKEVTPVCDKDTANTSCRITNSTLPGVTRFVYSSIVSLPPSPAWNIVFDGEMNNGSQAGRSTSISNISVGAGGGQLMYLEAFLNNLDEPNSSPQYTTIPTPFYCINHAQQYNQGAVDPDNDSLSFSLIPALVNNSTTNVVYLSPYSGTAPLAAKQGSFSFNSNSGQLKFLPDLLQRSLVVNRVQEYNNGKLVGSSMREMTFVVLDNCNNNPPNGDVDTNKLNGGVLRDNVINVCSNTPDLTFIIPIVDVDSNLVSVVINNIPSGATATVSGNKTSSPVINFSWNLQNVPIGIYNLFATYTDDACPLYSSQTIAYTIKVVNPFSITHDVVQPTKCIFRQLVQINIADGIVPYTVTVINEDNITVARFTDTNNVIMDSFKVGHYTVFAESGAIKCKTQYRFTVVDSGTYPIQPVHHSLDVCLNDEPRQLDATASQNTTLNWYTLDGELLPGRPAYSTNMPGTYKWLVSQTYDVCESRRDTISATVHDFPQIKTLNNPQRVCLGDGIYLLATGGVKYEWSPAEQVVYYHDSAFTYVTKPTTYTVKGYSVYGCVNTDTVTYNEIEQCCTFSYPDAFTPNHDGRNDGWIPITYGNVDFYLLSVYNRWGQRVFISSNPKEKWDGTFNGKDCDMDTYQYFLRATCVTGHKETAKGSFILLR